MSAWIVNREHIDVMLRAGFAYGVKGWGGNLCWEGGGEGDRELTHESADEVGRILWRENLRSIEARYPDTVENGDYPGPIDFEADQTETYTYRDPGFIPSAGETFQAVGCFEYQSCETDDWRESEAYRFCQALVDVTAAALYAGPWGWDRDEIAKRIDGQVRVTS